jgi:hypothetical protein
MEDILLGFMNAGMRAGRNERANIERFGDDEGRGGREAVGDLMGAVAQARAVHIPAELTKEKEDRLARELEDRKEGLNDPAYICMLCEFGSDGSLHQAISEGMRNIYNIIQSFKRRVSSNKLDDMVAKEYNKSIYRKVTLIGRKTEIQMEPMTRAKVRYHRTVCNRADPVEQLWNDADQIKIKMDHLWKNGNFTRPADAPDNDDAVIEIHQRNDDRWLKLCKERREIMMSIVRVEAMTAKDGEGGPMRRKLKIPRSFTDLQ